MTFDDLLDDQPVETPIQKQIRTAREELAAWDAAHQIPASSVEPLTEDADDWEQTPAIPEPLPALVAGDWVSFYGSVVLAVGDDEPSSFRAVYTRYGQDLELTEELLKYNESFWTVIDDHDLQRQKWRRDTPLVTRGKWPATEPRWERGSHEEDVARDTARAAAFQLTDEHARRAELRRIDDAYGLRPTSRSLAQYSGGLR